MWVVQVSAGELRHDLEQRFTDFVHPHSALVRRGLMADRGWPDELPGAWAELQAWFRGGVRFYSGDGGNFRADSALGAPPEATPVPSAEAG